MPKKHDWMIQQGLGGLVGNGHVDAGFANGGEKKAWYWLLASVWAFWWLPAASCSTFPNFWFSDADTMHVAPNSLFTRWALWGLTAVVDR